jgi:hypothetical protein
MNSSNKPELTRLIPFMDVLNDVTDVLKHGQEKYGEDKNWQSRSVESHIDAALRHTTKYAQEPDEETGHSHIVHAICRLLFAETNKRQNYPMWSKNNVKRVAKEIGICVDDYPVIVPSPETD